MGFIPLDESIGSTPSNSLESYAVVHDPPRCLVLPSSPLTHILTLPMIRAVRTGNGYCVLFPSIVHSHAAPVMMHALCLVHIPPMYPPSPSLPSLINSIDGIC